MNERKTKIKEEDEEMKRGRKEEEIEKSQKRKVYKVQFSE